MLSCAGVGSTSIAGAAWRPAGPGGLQLLHADASLIVIHKPAGLLAVPGLGAAGADHVAGRAQACWPDALVVHRLDMATSGLMLLARGPQVQRQLSMAFAARQVVKHYEAIVEGCVTPDHGEIDAPLRADWPRRPLQMVDRAHGKPSLTRWRVLQRLDGATRVWLQPVTGRSHQLRVHMQSVGHPIRGDALYAPAPLLAPRLLLHATQMALTHPATGQPVVYTCTPDF